MNELVIAEIAKYINDAGIATLGVDLFTGHMVPSPDNVVMVYAGVSRQPDMYLDTQYQTIDVWVRDAVSDTAGRRLNSIFNLLHRAIAIDTSNFHFYFIHALGNITDMDRDFQQRKMFKITFNAIYRNNNTVS